MKLKYISWIKYVKLFFIKKKTKQTNKSNGIISGYILKQETNAIKKKKLFKEEIKKMKKKYWDKYGVDKFFKENQIKLQNYLSTTDFEELQNKEQKKKFLYASRSTPEILSRDN